MACQLDTFTTATVIKNEVADGPVFFDGCRAHAVAPFTGERDSMVLYAPGGVTHCERLFRTMRMLGFPAYDPVVRTSLRERAQCAPVLRDAVVSVVPAPQ